jgi:hypothetical protein
MEKWGSRGNEPRICSCPRSISVVTDGLSDNRVRVTGFRSEDDHSRLHKDLTAPSDGTTPVDSRPQKHIPLMADSEPPRYSLAHEANTRWPLFDMAVPADRIEE